MTIIFAVELPIGCRRSASEGGGRPQPTRGSISATDRAASACARAHSHGDRDANGASGKVIELMGYGFIPRRFTGEGPATHWASSVTSSRMPRPSVMAVMGLQLGYLFGGSILVETVSNWPGVGFLLDNAIFMRDMPMLQGTVLLLALFFVVINLIVDLLQTTLDPRIQRARGRGTGAWRVGFMRSRRRPPTRRRAARDASAIGTALRGSCGATPRVAVRAHTDALGWRRSCSFSGAGRPLHTGVVSRLKPPGTPGHLLGTDELGRDLLTRLLYGGRLTLLMGVAPVLIASLVGGTLGLIGGFAGRESTR